MKWYYAIEGRAHGPVAEEKLAELAAEHAVGSETLLWQPGMELWEPVWKLRPEIIGHLSKSTLAQKARGTTDRIPVEKLARQTAKGTEAGTASSSSEKPPTPPAQPPRQGGLLSRLFGWGKKGGKGS